MIDALIRWSVGNRPAVVALAIAFLVWGGYTISEMPLDVLPDLKLSMSLTFKCASSDRRTPIA
jgi:Cu/Ag efflux pump CusA